eukprot:SAG22_NODE_1340_length_4691_cov_566.488240_2_plen_205_part_00
MADNMYKGNADPAGENRGLLGGRAGAGSVQEQVGLACTDGGLFGCFSDIPVCLTGWCCPCFLSGQSLKRTKQTGSTCAGCMIYMVPIILVHLLVLALLGSFLSDPAILAVADPRCYCNTTNAVAGVGDALGNTTADFGCFFCGSGSVDNSGSNRHDTNSYEGHVHGHVDPWGRRMQADLAADQSSVEATGADHRGVHVRPAPRK